MGKRSNQRVDAAVRGAVGSTVRGAADRPATRTTGTIKPSPNPGPRPVKARQFASVQRVADGLAGAGVRANLVSCFGMVAGLVAGLCFALTAPPVQTQPAIAATLWFLGGALVMLRGLANVVDGLVAAAQPTASPIGPLYNEAPDRISDMAILIGLGMADGSLLLGIGAALAAVLTAYVRTLGEALGAGSVFAGPMGKTQRIYSVSAFAMLMGALALFGFGRIDIVLPIVGPLNGAVLAPVPAFLLLLLILTGVTALRRLVMIAGRLRLHASMPEDPA